MDENPQNNYQEILDQLLEYRNYSMKLEKDLEKKNNEKQDYINLYNDIKELHQKVQKNNEDLRQQIQTLNEEKLNMENQYKNENKKLKEYLEIQKDNYEKQLKNINNLDEITLKNRITAEIEIKYTNIINEKNYEIQQLNDTINELKSENLKRNSEFEIYKNKTKNEFDQLNEKYNSDLKDLLNKFAENKGDNGINSYKRNDDFSPLMFQELKIQLNRSKEKEKDLNELLERIKTQNNNIIIASKTKEQNYLKEIESEKFKNELQNNQINNLTQKNLMLENEINELKALAQNAKNTLINVQKENENLNLMNNDLNVKIEEANLTLDNLKNLIALREEEMNQALLNYRNKNQQKFINEKENIEIYQKQIEDLNLHLKKINSDFKDYIDKNDNIKNEKEKENNKLIEEKKILIKRLNELQLEIEFLRGDYENKIRTLSHFQNEYNLIEGKYNMLNKKFIIYENSEEEFKKQLQNKEKEIQILNEIISKLKKDNGINKYNEVLKKKKYYKNKCKECNKNISIILNKLNPNERKEIEGSLIPISKKSSYKNYLSESQSNEEEKDFEKNE